MTRDFAFNLLRTKKGTKLTHTLFLPYKFIFISEEIDADGGLIVCNQNEDVIQQAELFIFLVGDYKEGWNVWISPFVTKFYEAFVSMEGKVGRDAVKKEALISLSCEDAVRFMDLCYEFIMSKID
jgi:hypothetical protein